MKKLLDKRIKKLENNILESDKVLIFFDGIIKFDDGEEYSYKEFINKYPKYKDNNFIFVVFDK